MQPTEELWKIIPSHPDYEASSLGRVRRSETGRIRKPQRHGHGLDNRKANGLTYLHLFLDGRTRYIHHLVLEAFVGPKPESHSDALHDNDDPTDNRLANLSWGTRTQNMADCRRNGNLVVGSRIPWSKLTEEAVREARERYAAGETQKALALEYGVTPSAMRRAILGLSWASVAA